jgi:DHA2 family multidrug resistance protein
VAASALANAVSGQGTVIAFDSAFIAVALLFVVAAPILILVKIGTAKFARSRQSVGAPIQ